MEKMKRKSPIMFFPSCLIVVFFTVVSISLSDGFIDRYFWNFDSCFSTEDKCPNKNVTFWLYSRESPNQPVQLDVENLQENNFLPKRPLEVLIHGYTGNKNSAPNLRIRPALLNMLDVNVISVDYGPLTKDPCYIFAVENSRTVGRCIAQLLDNLIQKGIYSLEDIHILGFSMGAQIAGLIANYMTSGKLKWITGLDPAKPIYNFFGLDGRLDPSDAEFVDVIHTDVLGNGMLATLGHVDFYPNGGFDQPGCRDLNNWSNGPCNHERAAEFYAESIAINTNGFWGYSCYNWLGFVLGLCKWSANLQVELMGYRVLKNLSGVFILETNPFPPYAIGPYPTANLTAQ